MSEREKPPIDVVFSPTRDRYNTENINAGIKNLDKTTVGQEPNTQAISNVREKIETIGAIDIKKKFGIEYEPAEWLDETTIQIGSKRYSNCEKIGEGGNGIVYKTFDPEHNTFVVVKIALRDNNTPLESTRTIKTTTEGETEETFQTRRDEIPLSIIQNGPSAEYSVYPRLYQKGQLPDGKHIVVKEFIEGEDDGRMTLHWLKSRFWRGDNTVMTDAGVKAFIKQNELNSLQSLKTEKKTYEPAINTKPRSWIEKIAPSVRRQREETEIIKKISVFKASLLLTVHDMLSAFQIMHDTHMVHRDVKMADYFVSPDIAEGINTPQNLEKKWRGVFVDWGNVEMRTDGKKRPQMVEEQVLADLLNRVLKGSIFYVSEGLPPLPLTKQPVLDKNREQEKIAEIINNELAPLYKTFQEIYAVCQERTKNPTPNLKATCEAGFEKLNSEAKKLGLKINFKYPL